MEKKAILIILFILTFWYKTSLSKKAYHTKLQPFYVLCDTLLTAVMFESLSSCLFLWQQTNGLSSSALAGLFMIKLPPYQ